MYTAGEQFKCPLTSLYEITLQHKMSESNFVRVLFGDLYNLKHN